MLLSLRHITHFYGSRLIFKDVSLDIASGSVTLLAGANGAGKSTLLRIMAGLVQPSSGEVVSGQGKSGEAVPVAYLGHNTFLYPELTALENLAFWSAMHGTKRPRASYMDMLERVELTSFAEEKAKSFSRGMAQRLNLARVFLQNPELLLLDEPATGLDTRSTGILFREIAAARATGAGIVWITHSLADDLHRADMAAILENRKLAFYGTAHECITLLRDGEATPQPFETPVMASGGELC